VIEYTSEIGDRVAALLTLFKLPSAADQMTKRFLDAGCDQALVTLVEVLEVEAQARRERRVDRLRRASRLPPAKTFDTLDASRVPRTVLIQARELARGEFVERATTCFCSAVRESARVTSRALSVTRWSAPASACCSRRRISSYSNSSPPVEISACHVRCAPSIPSTS